VRERLKQAFTSYKQQQPERLPPLPHWQEIIEQLTGLPVPQRAPLRDQEQLTAAVFRISQRHRNQLLPNKKLSKPSAATASEPHPQGQGRQAVNGATHDAGVEAGAHSQGILHAKAVRALGEGVGAHNQRGAKSNARRALEGDARKGVFHTPRKRARGGAWQDGQDAAFFMGLQGGNSEAASEVSGSSDDSLADG